MMLDRALEAQVDYLDRVKKLSGQEVEAILNDPSRIKPGPMQFPDGILDKNPFAESDPQKAIDAEIFAKVHPLAHQLKKKRPAGNSREMVNSAELVEKGLSTFHFESCLEED
jgi:hypothetical protein